MQRCCRGMQGVPGAKEEEGCGSAGCAGLVAGAVPGPVPARGRQRTETKAGRPGPGGVGWGGVAAGAPLTCTAGRGGHGAPRLTVTGWESGPGGLASPAPCTERPAPPQGGRWAGGAGRGGAGAAGTGSPGPLLPPPGGAADARRPDVTRARRRPAPARAAVRDGGGVGAERSGTERGGTGGTGGCAGGGLRGGGSPVRGGSGAERLGGVGGNAEVMAVG